MQHGGRDFRTGKPIDVHAYFDDSIDIHHIFPKKWCTDNGIESDVADSVVNKTAIDARTNKIIGGDAPSRYLTRLEERDGIEPAELNVIVRSHGVDPMALRCDDFAVFFAQRFEYLVAQIEEAMGKPANRSKDGDDNPFAADSDTLEHEVPSP